ncbi:MAG: dipeptide epimerase [Pirellulaceae bacterium]|nr:MAG: dipeptide epimerase [Pirellulaceae bacterium]
MIYLRAFHYHLPLRHTFTISRGSIQVQPTVIVELSDQEGRYGYGEATTNSYYGVTVESLVKALRQAKPVVEQSAWDGPETLWDRLQPLMAESSFALSAIDQAAWDLWGKQHGQPVYRLWQLDTSNIPVSNYTIGIDTIERMVEKLREFPDWPIYKIKLGTTYDLQIVRRLRCETNAVFRVDANCGWTEEETLHNALVLKSLGVEFIEQPLPADQWEPMRRLYQKSVLPLIADESCLQESDVAKCHGYFHGVNIKLVKCGGLTPARRMIETARRLGMKVMVGCMTESTVGISAIAQLLPLLDYVDMDGAVLLAEDIADGVRLERGRAVYPDRPGSGVRLLRYGRPLCLEL